MHLGVPPLRYPRISQDIPRYPTISIHQDMFWICSGYLFGIIRGSFRYLLDIFGYLLGYFQDILIISIDLPPVSRAIHLLIQSYPSVYPEISIYLSRAIHLFIQRYPCTYPELSIYLSRAIHLFIQRYPSFYPKISIYLSRDILPYILHRRYETCTRVHRVHVHTRECSWKFVHSP